MQDDTNKSTVSLPMAALRRPGSTARERWSIGQNQRMTHHKWTS
jgi:hypothetical protein